MTDIYFILIAAFTTVFSFCFFILATSEGIGKVGDIDFARALIYYFASMLTGFLSIAMTLSMDTPFALSFWYIPFMFVLLDFIMVIFTSYKSYLHRIETEPGRNRRYYAE